MIRNGGLADGSLKVYRNTDLLARAEAQRHEDPMILSPVKAISRPMIPVDLEIGIHGRFEFEYAARVVLHTRGTSQNI